MLAYGNYFWDDLILCGGLLVPLGKVRLKLKLSEKNDVILALFQQVFIVFWHFDPTIPYVSYFVVFRAFHSKIRRIKTRLFFSMLVLTTIIVIIIILILINEILRSLLGILLWKLFRLCLQIGLKIFLRGL